MLSKGFDLKLSKVLNCATLEPVALLIRGFVTDKYSTQSPLDSKSVKSK